MRHCLAFPTLLLLGSLSLTAQQTAPPDASPTPQVMRPGGGVKPPLVIRKVEPVYTEEARCAKLQGTVVLRMVIRPDGKPHNIRVDRSLGSGLDEQAIAAVQQWEFQPATKDGQPVAVLINVEIEFRIDHGSTPTPTPEGVAESAALKAVFDSLAARVVKSDFDGAYKFLSEETTKEISPNRLASRYKMLEAEHGLLQSIAFAASWTSRVTLQSPVRTGMVVARHRSRKRCCSRTCFVRKRTNGSSSDSGPAANSQPERFTEFPQ